MKKFALVNFGNEESYGLLFAATEFKKHGDIRFFDSIDDRIIQNLVDYAPDYVCFSPLTVFMVDAKAIERVLRTRISFVSIYGGHHASNCKYQCGDISVAGGVAGLDLSSRGKVNNGPVLAKDLKVPAREEYYRDIPRLRNRYRKIMLSMVGCPFHCTYCSSKHDAESLERRDMEDIFAEARFIKDSTLEIEWVDDDVFTDDDWVCEFFPRWQKEIGLPMYVSTTTINALKASDTALRTVRNTARCVGLGIQAIHTESLKLLGRSWDNAEQMIKAYHHLTAYGFRVNLQGIIGLPVDEPLKDALDTVEAMTIIGKGSIASVYPLQVYPNTPMERILKQRGYKLNPLCRGDTNSGLPAIDFGEQTNNRLRNLCKLATMAIKYGISRDWLASMLDLDLSGASEQMSKVRYEDCFKDRLPNADFNSVLETMRIKH